MRIAVALHPAKTAIRAHRMPCLGWSTRTTRTRPRRKSAWGSAPTATTRASRTCCRRCAPRRRPCLPRTWTTSASL